MSKENAKIKHYSNGSEVRLRNRKINVTETEKGDIIIQFRHADKLEDPNKPACEHHCHRGKVRQTTVKVSEVGMEALAIAIVEYMKIKTRARKRKELEQSEKTKEGYKWFVLSYKADGQFVGYLSAYTESGMNQFTPSLRNAIPFDTKAECIYSEGQRWDLKKEGEDGYYKTIQYNTKNID